MAFTHLVVVFALLCTVKSLVVDYKDCGSKLGKPVKVEISPCKVQPCALVRGTNASIDVSFISDVAVTKVKISLQGVIFGARIPFPVPHDEPCQYPPSKLKCPVKAGIQQVYELVLPVQKGYPKLKLEAELSLVNEENTTDIVCVMIPVQITD